jgi:hypothetical protein
VATVLPNLLRLRTPYWAEEDSVVRAIASALVITGALVLSGIAVPTRAQTGQSVPTQNHKCDVTGGPYPGFVRPYAYEPYHYGYPPDCGGFSVYPPTFYGYGYPEYQVPTRHKRDMKDN